MPHLQPSVLASQLTSWASTAFLEVGQVMHPCPDTLATHRATEATRSIILAAQLFRYRVEGLSPAPAIPGIRALRTTGEMDRSTRSTKLGSKTQGKRPWSGGHSPSSLENPSSSPCPRGSAGEREGGRERLLVDVRQGRRACARVRVRE